MNARENTRTRAWQAGASLGSQVDPQSVADHYRRCLSAQVARQLRQNGQFVGRTEDSEIPLGVDCAQVRSPGLPQEEISTGSRDGAPRQMGAHAADAATAQPRHQNSDVSDGKGAHAPIRQGVVGQICVGGRRLLPIRPAAQAPPPSRSAVPRRWPARCIIGLTGVRTFANIRRRCFLP
jgi:hypothetical protein